MIASALAGMVVLWFACGGRVFRGIPGSLDDSGAFRSMDGAIVFAPGSFCVGPLANPYNHPLCDECGSNDDVVACRKWLETHTPFQDLPDASWQSACRVLDDEKDRCVVHAVDFPLQLCEPGPSGDAYCSALYQQFVVNGGKAVAYCAPGCVNDQFNRCPGGFPPMCGINGECSMQGGACDTLCVRHDGGALVCEEFCAPAK
jgi:hypothetical protein